MKGWCVCEGGRGKTEKRVGGEVAPKHRPYWDSVFVCVLCLCGRVGGIERDGGKREGEGGV